MTIELWRMNALDLANCIRERKAGAVEATESVLRRVAQVNHRYRPLATVDTEGALAAAREADRRQAKGEVLGPLHGVPVSIKLDTDVAGWCTDNGIVARKDVRASQDAPAVANLRRAGAILIGQSNVPCMSFRAYTENDLHGRTINPHDESVTPGGSSGGAGVAAALGLGAIHLGSDRGGSVRLPAFASGVVGLRPTAGRIALFNATLKEERSLVQQTMAVLGPIARTIADVRLSLSVLAGGDPRDPLWTPAPLEQDMPAPIKVALFKRWRECEADPAVVASLEHAAQALAQAGCVVEECEPPHFAEAEEVRIKTTVDDLLRRAPAIAAQADRGTRLTLEHLLALSKPGTVDEVLAAWQRRFTIARAWSLFLCEYPLILMPISWRHRIGLDEDIRSVESYRRLLRDLSPLTVVAMLGLPGLSVPTGMADGLPSGVQIVSARFREDIALKAGEIIERASGFCALDRLAPT